MAPETANVIHLRSSITSPGTKYLPGAGAPDFFAGLGLASPPPNPCFQGNADVPLSPFPPGVAAGVTCDSYKK